MHYLCKQLIRIFSLGNLLLCSLSYAEATGIGAVANNLMTPVGLFSDFIYTGCIVLGASFIFAGIIKYIDHRRSPLFVPISTVVFLFFAGILLLILPFAYKFIQHGTPYTLLRK